MPLISWSSNFSVNVKDMDTQHQALIDITNQLHEALMEGKGSIVVNATVDKMIDYAKRHFKDEEAILTLHRYPGFAQQKANHDAFISKSIEFKKEVSLGNRATSVAVCNFLKEWWTSHILVEDKQYGVYLNSKGIK
jgi:hemerythrin